MAPLIVDGRILPRQADYIRLGQRRQGETLSALAQLGVEQEQVFFLGYPDGGLKQLGNNSWLHTDPITAPYTGATRSPYENSYNPGAVYLGSHLHGDLLAILKKCQPDIVVMPHPQDTHLDHNAVSSFAQLALTHYLTTAVYKPLIVLGYLVHYKRYPVPRTADMNSLLLPPAPLTNQGQGWLTYTLSRQERLNKMEALHIYASQMKIIGHYLRRFVRANEIFFELPAMEIPEPGCAGAELFETGTALFAGGMT
jgi:LmbE family N-acetylglucosaminyl deacetylase